MHHLLAQNREQSAGRGVAGPSGTDAGAGDQGLPPVDIEHLPWKGDQDAETTRGRTVGFPLESSRGKVLDGRDFQIRLPVTAPGPVGAGTDKHRKGRQQDSGKNHRPLHGMGPFRIVIPSGSVKGIPELVIAAPVDVGQIRRISLEFRAVQGSQAALDCGPRDEMEGHLLPLPQS